MLAGSQHGFRPMHSTSTALPEATNNWYLNIDDGLINSVLFLDLKKAFDMIDHNILLKKVQLYGLDLHAVQWFKIIPIKSLSEYLCKLSDHLPFSCGVPQGFCTWTLLVSYLYK